MRRRGLCLELGFQLEFGGGARVFNLQPTKETFLLTLLHFNLLNIRPAGQNRHARGSNVARLNFEKKKNTNTNTEAEEPHVGHEPQA